jgi:2-isopropylmalate synthase
MAGADRVEGCLFGNGERTGNCCLVTVALNMYTQGVDPGLDFSDIDEVIKTVEYCNQLPCRTRAIPMAANWSSRPFRAAIRTRSRRASPREVQNATTSLGVPYLPIDPADLGRDYEAVIRVNSQSGKGGFAWVLEQDQGLKLPKRMQAHFSGHVQQLADELGRELFAEDIWQVFQRVYHLNTPQHFQLSTTRKARLPMAPGYSQARSLSTATSNRFRAVAMA